MYAIYKARQTYFGYFLICAGLLFVYTGVSALPRVPVQQVVFQNNRFACDFYRKMAGRPGNILFSPYALSSGFAILYLGAKEGTEEEIAERLHFQLPAGYLAESFRQIQNLVGEERGYFLATSLWVQNRMPLNSSFVERVQKFFPNQFFEVDFELKSDSSRADINQFVAAKTKKGFPNFLSVSDLARSARMQIVLAAYFEASFSFPADPLKSSMRPFFFNTSRSRDVFTLHFKGSFPYVEQEDYQLVELPFQKSNPQEEGIGLILLIPKEVEGLKAMDKKLSFEQLSPALANLNAKVMSLEIPRFRLQPLVDLKPFLIAYGVKKPFLPDANFKGITETTPLYLQKTVDRNLFQLTEKGVNIRGVSGKDKPQEEVLSEEEPLKIAANRPFLFFLYDNRSNQILLMGRCQEP